MSAWVAAALAGLVLVAGLLVLLFAGAAVNHWGKPRLERAFAGAQPGAVLHIGDLDYAVLANRLVARSIAIHASNQVLRLERVSVTGVRWSWLMRGAPDWGPALAEVRLDATNLHVTFPRAHYELRWTRLRASVPAAELIAEGATLRALGGDEAFFAAHEFRQTRLELSVPEVRMQGLAYGDLLRGESYVAGSIELLRPELGVLVPRYKPAKPFVRSPLMVHEALAAIGRPLRVGTLRITDGLVTYSEGVEPGAEPAVLSFGDVNLSAEGVANLGEAGAAIEIRGQGSLMHSGVLVVRMSIPIAPEDFSMRYSGSLGAMDVRRLDAFLDVAEHLRIKSGDVKEASFEIDVGDGHARGRVRAAYENLEVAMLDRETGTEAGLDNRVVSWLANLLHVRASNDSTAMGTGKEGQVNYTRAPDDEFLQFIWFALRSGVVDVMSQ